MTEAYINRTIEAYNRDPATYVATTEPMIMKDELRAFGRLVPDTNRAVLDAGCAYGRDAAILVGQGLDVTGVDLSDALIAKAHDLHPEIPVSKMDVRKLTFPDSTFGGVWCNAVLLHLNDDDVARALGEFNRVLIPGGVILVSFKEGSGQREFVESLTSTQSRYYNYKTKPEVERMMQEAGFTIRRSYTLNEREVFGPDKRDLNWIYSFGIKNSGTAAA
jgi:SAM-dependent methyltransferase